MGRAQRPDRSRGVFETMLVLGGSPVELDAHLLRLTESLQQLFGQGPAPATRELVLSHARPLELGRLRVTVAPDAQGLRAEVVTASVEPADVFPAWERAAQLRVLVVAGGLGAHKWADRTLLAAAESGAGPRGVPLLVDKGDEVLEASRANVFAVEGETLLTPPADGRILPGVTRARAIEAAAALGIDVREEPLTRERLRRAGEAFLTGSIRGVEPVGSIDGAGLRPPGDAASSLAAELRRAWMGGGERPASASQPVTAQSD